MRKLTLAMIPLAGVIGLAGYLLRGADNPVFSGPPAAAKRPSAAAAAPAANTAAASPLQAERPRATGKLAPDFTLKDLSGKDVTLSSYRGKKVVILEFWATWCGPCRLVMPALQRYEARNSENVEVLSINQQEDADRVSSFLKSHNFTTLHVLLDIEGRVSSAYRVFGLPTLFIIDKEGVMRYKHIGYRADLEKQLEKAITPLI